MEDNMESNDFDEKTEIDNWMGELIEEYKKANPHVDLSGENICVGLVNRKNGNKLILRKNKGQWEMVE